MSLDIPKELFFTTTHEWVRQEGNIATIGITDYAQSQLSDLTYVELPAIGDSVAAQDEVAVIESVKAASDVYAPVGGTIEEVNERLNDKPELINSDPFGDGWLFKIKVEDQTQFDELLDPDQYEDLTPED